MRLADTLRRLPWDDRRRAGGFGHAVRLLSLLTLTLDELDEATGALVANIEHQEELEAVHGSRPEDFTAEQQELFEEGGRLSVTVHHRVDTFFALARLLLDGVAHAVESDLKLADGVRLGTHRQLEERLAATLPPRNALVAKAQRLTCEVFGDRDLHVTLERYGRTMTASVWSSTGDAGISPGRRSDGVSLAALRDLLEEYVADVADYLASGRSL